MVVCTSFVFSLWKIAFQTSDKNLRSLSKIITPGIPLSVKPASSTDHSAARLFFGFLDGWSVNDVLGVTSCESTKLR